MPSRRVAQEAFPEEVTRLLAERGWSLRRLARDADVDVAQLSRVIRRADRKTPSPRLVQRVASTFGLPHDYFIEYRENLVIQEIRANPQLRERIYRRLRHRAG